MMTINEIKEYYPELSEFITGIDNEGKVIFLPENDFFKKFNLLDEKKEQIFIMEINELLELEVISIDTIKSDWATNGFLSYLRANESNFKTYWDVEREYQEIQTINEILMTLDTIEKKMTWLKLYRMGIDPFFNDNSISKSEQRIIKYIDNSIISLEYKKGFTDNAPKLSSKTFEQENPHPRIFKNGECWNLFKYLKTLIKNDLADFSFFYHKMKYEGFIFEDIEPKEYKNWIEKEFGIIITQLKQLYRCTTPEKEKLFSLAKTQFNL